MCTFVHVSLSLMILGVKDQITYSVLTSERPYPWVLYEKFETLGNGILDLTNISDTVIPWATAIENEVDMRKNQSRLKDVHDWLHTEFFVWYFLQQTGLFWLSFWCTKLIITPANFVFGGVYCFHVVLPFVQPSVHLWHFVFCLISWKHRDGYSSVSADTLISIRYTYIRKSEGQGPWPRGQFS